MNKKKITKIKLIAAYMLCLTHFWKRNTEKINIYLQHFAIATYRYMCKPQSILYGPTLI